MTDAADIQAARARVEAWTRESMCGIAQDVDLLLAAEKPNAHKVFGRGRQVLGGRRP